jgi:hypothetical protein
VSGIFALCRFPSLAAEKGRSDARQDDLLICVHLQSDYCFTVIKENKTSRYFVESAGQIHSSLLGQLQCVLEMVQDEVGR